MRAAFAILVVLVAGCLAPVETIAPAAPVPSLDDVLPIVQDHDHSDAALHEGIAGFELVGWHNGFSDDGTWPTEGGSVNELAMHGTHAFLARSGPQGGFVVLDVSDPAAITKIGAFDGEGTADIDLSFDGLWAFASTQRTVPAAGALVSSPLAHTPRGVYVVDVSDPSAPRLESFHPLPINGPHTATYAEIDGKAYVVLQTYDLLNQPAAGVFGALGATQRIWITEFVSDNGRMVLRPVAVYAIPALGVAGEVFPHDSSIDQHPDGRWIMSVAYWDGGLRLVDVSDPRSPKEVSAFTDFHPSTEVNLHDVKPFPVLIGGRHVTVTGPELPTSPEDGQLTFVDTTDAAKPAWLGHWSLPGDNVVDVPFLYSPHVFVTTETGMVYIGHNHGGVWAIDASDPASPRTAGYFFPNHAREAWGGPIPSTWGVRSHDGLVYATDTATGLYALRPRHVPS